MTEQQKAVLDAALAYDEAYWVWWNNATEAQRRITQKVRDDAQDALFEAVRALKDKEN